ncbi:LysM domain-containing protein [Bacillus sp. OV322]|uniref:LysM peptidoglycan-binding domain-containing protein n=1 Tax=Bacillus sp. OV322 TaxID=1882764 RepID=UPI0008E96F6E|nr:LysM peptidoglycan-binding domain-containing protein [Bacillus sp. OV322]SFC44288.1 LysM domain-containing protein [Bacillus sp. OV322]
MDTERTSQQDQAHELRTKAERLKTNPPLPSRSEIHRNKKKKTKLKIKFPLLKLLALFFILLPITIYFLNAHLKSPLKILSHSEPSNVEQVEIVDEPVSTAGEIEKDASGKTEKKSADSVKTENQSAPQKAESASPALDRNAKTASAAPEKKAVPALPAPEKKAETASAAPKKAETVRAQKKAAPAYSGKANSAPAASASHYKILLHTVKPQETMYHISMTYYHSKDGIPLIMKWNHLSGYDLAAGQILKIPIKQ